MSVTLRGGGREREYIQKFVLFDDKIIFSVVKYLLWFMCDYYCFLWFLLTITIITILDYIFFFYRRFAWLLKQLTQQYNKYNPSIIFNHLT